MGYTVMLDFDKEGQKIIKSMVEAICDAGMNDFMKTSTPHLAIASYREIDEEKFLDKFEEFAKKGESLKLRFESVGIFYFDRNIIYLAPVMNEDLAKIHKDFHEEFTEEYAQYAFEHYKPNKWVPNCRLAVNATMEETLNAVNALKELFKPIEVKIDGIRVVDYNSRENKAQYNFLK